MSDVRLGTATARQVVCDLRPRDRISRDEISGSAVDARMIASTRRTRCMCFEWQKSRSVDRVRLSGRGLDCCRIETASGFSERLRMMISSELVTGNMKQDISRERNWIGSCETATKEYKAAQESALSKTRRREFDRVARDHPGGCSMIFAEIAAIGLRIRFGNMSRGIVAAINIGSGDGHASGEHHRAAGRFVKTNFPLD